MFEPSNLLWGIPSVLLLGALLAAILGATPLRKLSALPLILCCLFACNLVLSVIGKIPADTHVLRTATPLTWFAAGPVQVNMSLAVDPLTAIFLLTITFIGTLIVIFSMGYMKGDPGYPRFFAIVGLFLAAMCLLVMGDNFLSMFAGWEGVGLCSYLLVGYWYSKPSAAAAARKAFLVTRLGDVGLILGIAVLWSLSGYSLEFDAVLSEKNLAHLVTFHPHLLALSCLLIFCGAVGKSAQYPLYVWLPDAMEGPTPVSALIHAATMVTAGVYLLARCSPLFALADGVQVIVASIGGLTAIIAGFIAVTQNDLKRVLAYSTVSQLGYMFMALGCVGPVPAEVAATAAVFHVFTHAFFKAVLFLSAGSVMHAMGDVIDMRKFGGLRHLLPKTHLAFLCGAAALAGLPLLSGFWSKDMILDSLLEATESRYGAVYWVLFGVGILTAGMTAFYTFRAYFRTFHGVEKIPAEAGHHAHESPSVMTVPLAILAFGAVFVGLIAEAFGGYFSHFLSETPVFLTADKGKAIHHETNWFLMIGSSVVAIAGVYFAYVVYGSGSMVKANANARRWSGLYQASLNKLYVDELYAVMFVAPFSLIAQACRGIESILFDLVHLVATLPKYVGEVFRPMQNGLVQFYGLSMVMGVVAFIGYLVLWAGK